MILPDFILPSRVNQCWQYSGMDSLEYCQDKKHFESYPYSIEYRYNSRGFRDSEWPTDLNQLEQAVWCVGDSFTVGLGSPLEHTWPYQVGTALNKRTVNVSMDGASNYWIARKTVDIINEIGPELIIIQWSYIHRGELEDSALSDEDRRMHLHGTVHSDDSSDIELGYNFIKLLQQVELNKQDTRIIHSFIPTFGIQVDLHIVWNQICGPSWPAMPATLSEFENLDAGIIDELTNFFKLYEKFDIYYKLIDNIEYIPMITRLDVARDGHHYDLLTAKQFAASVSKLILNRAI